MVQHCSTAKRQETQNPKSSGTTEDKRTSLDPYLQTTREYKFWQITRYCWQMCKRRTKVGTDASPGTQAILNKRWRGCELEILKLHLQKVCLYYYEHRKVNGKHRTSNITYENPLVGEIFLMYPSPLPSPISSPLGLCPSFVSGAINIC